jgi:hypothetical protein
VVGGDAIAGRLRRGAAQAAGFPLETRSRVTVLGDVQETLSTVTRVKVGPAERRLFEPPPGYRLEPDTEEAP